MKTQKLKYHPIIACLKISEDGSVIIFNGTKLTPKPSKRGTYNYERVNFLAASHMVVRLVCETYNGMAPNPSYSAKRIKGVSNHYTNLKWERHGGNSVVQIKLTDKDRAAILLRLEHGEIYKTIAEDYKVSQTHIGRIKKQGN